MMNDVNDHHIIMQNKICITEVVNFRRYRPSYLVQAIL